MLLAAGARRKAGTSSPSSRNAKSSARTWASRTRAESMRMCSNIASTVMRSMYHTDLTRAVSLTVGRLQPNARRVRAALAVACAAFACSKNAQPSDQLLSGVRGAVLQHHNDAARSGVYVDASLTRAAVGRLRQDTAFNAPLQGAVYAQPLYWDGRRRRRAGSPDRRHPAQRGDRARSAHGIAHLVADARL